MGSGTFLLGHAETVMVVVSRSASGAAPVAHVTDSDPHADRAYTDAQLALLADDPFGLGFPSSFPPGLAGGQQTWAAANEVRFARLVSGGSCSKVGFQVFISSGNIAVAAYRSTGAGRSRAPGTRLAVSAIIPCPGAGLAQVDLGATLDMDAGDFFALWCDNTTAAFSCVNGATSPLYAGYGYTTNDAAGPPSPVPGSASATVNKMPLLIGTT
jgi:hypothetical protein